MNIDTLTQVTKKYLSTKWRQNKWVLGLIIICIIGIVFRSVHYSDWLVFKSDQARDALIMTQAMSNGFSSLPLLGPEAGSTKFRLGPITYYFQYISGELFGAMPESYAYPDLIFGILTLPLFFFLFRKFLSLTISFWLTALASISLFLVTFSRFAWNPNLLPFFTTLFAWFFLNALENQEKQRQYYLTGAAICMGIIAQLHLVAILGLGIGLGIFLMFSRALRSKEIFLGIIIAILLQFPIFIHEWQTGGANTNSFISAISGEKYQDKNHSCYEKLFRAYQEGSHITWIITTGQQNTDTLVTRGLAIKCDQKCQTALPYSLMAMIIFTLILWLTFHRLRSETATKQKLKVGFIGSWLFGFLIVTILVAYETEVRFYLGIIPVLFLSLGFAAEYFLNHPLSQKYTLIKIVLYSIGIVMILLNIKATSTYLYELATSKISAEDSSRDLRFGTESKVTLGQLRAIATEAKAHFTSNVPVLITGESHHVKSMYYVLTSEYGYRGCYLRGEIKNIPPGFNHLFIEEYNPSLPEGLTPFGTLGAIFQSTESLSSDVTLPEKCLTY